MFLYASRPPMSLTTYYQLNTGYCTISFNSAGPVTRDGPAEILVSATSQNRRDKPKFWEFFGSLASQATNFFINWSHDHQMNSAPNKNYRDYRDISGFWRASWRVTAELNEMVQYSHARENPHHHLNGTIVETVRVSPFAYQHPHPASCCSVCKDNAEEAVQGGTGIKKKDLGSIFLLRIFLVD